MPLGQRTTSKDKYCPKCSGGEVAQPLQLSRAVSSSSLGFLRALKPRAPLRRVLHGMGWAQVMPEAGAKLGSVSCPHQGPCCASWPSLSSSLCSQPAGESHRAVGSQDDLGHHPDKLTRLHRGRVRGPGVRGPWGAAGSSWVRTGARKDPELLAQPRRTEGVG